MGCASSKEAVPQRADGPETTQTPRPRSITAQRQTSEASIHPTSTRASQNFNSTRNLIQPSNNTSTPRSSTHQSPRIRSAAGAEASLTEHYNLPLSQPRSWTSTDRTWTRSQLQKEREDFFHTRVTGSPQIWGALKECTALIQSYDLPTAQSIINAAGITLPSGDLTIGAYDELGQLYKIPQHILTDPENLIHDQDGAETIVGDEALSKKIDLEDKSLALDSTILDEKSGLDKGKESIEADAQRIRCRLSDRGGPDVVVMLGMQMPVSTLIRRLRNEAVIPGASRVRLVYFGKILDEQKTLVEQGWREGHVVQALVSNLGS